MSSFVVDFDKLADPLADAALFLAQRDVVGIVWLGPDLTVRSSAGILAGNMIGGEPITRSLLPLIGLEEDILAMKTNHPSMPVRLVNVAVMSSADVEPRRLNIFVFWSPARQKFLVLLGAIFMQGSPSSDLDQEIRRRRLLEQDLAAQSQEYARINQQLEEFAYVISHDLNAPLRAMRYLSADVASAIGATASGSAVDLAYVRNKVDAIATQTQRMSRMLTDLLDYSRIGRVNAAVATIDARQMIDDIVSSLRPSTTLAMVVAGTWPEIATAAAPLDLVLRNLVENAVKHHDRPDGRVDINAELQADAVQFRICDDGPGIPPQWQEAIFEPFRKIDDAHSPDSSGIGLALVKKTVASVGGAIEVISGAPAQRGTTFAVTWPLRLKASDQFPLR